MRDPLSTVLAIVTTIVLVAAGCSVSSSGSPIPSSTTTSITVEPRPSSTPTSAPPADRHGAPRVANPVDVTQYLTQPCTAVSPRLLQALGLPSQGKPDTTSTIGRKSPSCDWRAGPELIGVIFLKGNKNGLADLYRQEEVFRDAEYWEETTVEGYPGLFHSTVDSRGQGICNLSVGLSDALAMSVNEDGQLGTGSCERAKNFAAAVIKTLKGQG